jgi:predicted transcriptional regulator
MEKTIKIGIMPQEEFRAMMLKTARGEYRPPKDSPKIWFASMRSLAEVLSDRNRELVRIIALKKPETVAALSRETGRAVSNLSKTLKTLAAHGIVEVRVEGNTRRPIAKYTKFLIAA